MAGKPPEALQSLFPSRFVPFTQTKPRRRGRREDAGGKLSRTGIFDLNANGSELAAAVLRDCMANLGTCGVLWAPDLLANEVAGAIVSSDTKGVTPIRVDRQGRYTLYLADLFDHYPQFRVYGGNKVKVSRPDGLNILVVHLSVSLTTKTRTRSSENSTDAPQQEATKAKTAKKAKAATKQKGEAAASVQDPAQARTDET